MHRLKNSLLDVMIMFIISVFGFNWALFKDVELMLLVSVPFTLIFLAVCLALTILDK